MKKPIIFIQPAHPYRHDLFVCAGANLKQFQKFLRDNVKGLGNKSAKKLIKDIGTQDEIFEKVLDGKQLGYALNYDRWLVLILPLPKDNWTYYESLLHELSHILDWIVEMKMLEGEGEARAYLHEWLFREIRRKLL